MITTPPKREPQQPLRLPYRKLVLLSLLQRFGGRLSNRDFQKHLMLFTTEFGAHGSYDFVPYRFGGFSFQSYADRRSLVAAGLLVDAEGWQIAKAECYARLLSRDDNHGLDRLHYTFGKLRGRPLVRELYRRYPYYAINSEIAHEIMTRAELTTIDHARPSDEDECLFTIGYEGISFDAYLSRLVANNIKLLCDVRRNPLSRKYGFSKSTLRDAVESLGIQYMHIPELGISSEKRRNLETPADYKKLFGEYECTTIAAGSEKISEVAAMLRLRKRIALTCFEADVCMCHRSRIVDALARLPSPPAAIKHL
jgi:Protein of unknown function, DUF488